MEKISIKKIQQLCTKEEFKIVNASLSPEKLGVDRIKKLTTLSRRLRDKFKVIANRQKREMTGKAAPRRANPSLSNQGAKTKSQIFQQTLVRFQKALDASKRQTKKTTAKKRGSKTNSKPANKNLSNIQKLLQIKRASQKAKKKGGKVNMATASKVSKGSTLAKKTKAMVGRISARGKRTQAKKDSRNQAK